jgi:hypothetical protein
MRNQGKSLIPDVEAVPATPVEQVTSEPQEVFDAEFEARFEAKYGELFAKMDRDLLETEADLLETLADYDAIDELDRIIAREQTKRAAGDAADEARNREYWLEKARRKWAAEDQS